MDIRTLLGNLHEELSCSLCKCSFTEPKQLPCLHNFCLPCLNGVQLGARLSTELNVIACPECRQEFRVPENGNLGALPTPFVSAACSAFWPGRSVMRPVLSVEIATKRVYTVLIVSSAVNFGVTTASFSITASNLIKNTLRWH